MARKKLFSDGSYAEALWDATDCHVGSVEFFFWQNKLFRRNIQKVTYQSSSLGFVALWFPYWIEGSLFQGNSLSKELKIPMLPVCINARVRVQVCHHIVHHICNLFYSW